MVLEEVALNSTGVVPAQLEPVVGFVRGFFIVSSTLLGGLFGLYFIFLLLKFLYDRKILKEVKFIRKELDALTKKLGRRRKR